MFRKRPELLEVDESPAKLQNLPPNHEGNVLEGLLALSKGNPDDDKYQHRAKAPASKLFCTVAGYEPAKKIIHEVKI